MPTIPPALAAALNDRYRLDRELGRGGMATVFLAHDLRNNRPVALKLLRPELTAVLGAERFLKEIETTANLQHPHILPLFDSGESAGFLFYVMPYVEGESLRDRLDRERQLPVGDAVRIATEVAGALDYAHRRGIIHRDIKPDNIMLQDGNAVVADFGIALAVDAAGGERLTETGLAVGTPHYMSPEQSMGERSLDGRSDIYALGSVLYEMLAGEPPYTGPTAQAVAAKRMTQPVPSVRTLRETVPEALDQVLSSALAKSPADRFATAREFAEALQGHTQRTLLLAPATARPGRRVRLGVAVLLLLLTIAVLWSVLRRRSATTALDPNLLAVVPFDVIDPSLGVWGEGVVDLLSRTLDGAGSLRTVSPSVVLYRWQGRSDRASATAVARRAGAGLAATGSLNARGGDSVEVRASLLDIERGAVLGEVEVFGTTPRLGELVDSLGFEILRALSRDRPVGAVRRLAIGSAPLPALKAFLRGEQFYRRAEYDSALAAYAEAITRDSTLALAYYRMGQVRNWNPPTGGAYEEAEVYLAQAHRRNHGLSERDSLLIAADSAFAAQQSDPEQRKLIFARFNTLVERFPGDPESWYSLGEAFRHAKGAAIPGDNRRSLDAFDRAIALDSNFLPAYEHVLGLAVQLGGPERALPYARAATRLAMPGVTSSALGLTSRLLLTPEDRREKDLAGQLDAAAAGVLFTAAIEVFNHIPDSAETAVMLFRRLAARRMREGESAPWVVDSLMRLQFVAMALARRGHLAEAYRTDRALLADPTLSPWSWFQDPFRELALLRAIPRDEAARAFAPSLQPGFTLVAGSSRSLTGLGWWAMQQDTAALALFGRRMRDAGARAGDPVRRLRAGYLEQASAGYLALALGDTTEALRQFGAVPTSACSSIDCFYVLTQATLLAARGQETLAASQLDHLLTAVLGPIAVLARLERGRIAERLSDPETAIRSYQYVVDAWRRADPELQPYVAEARDGLARLAGERR